MNLRLLSTLFSIFIFTGFSVSAYLLYTLSQRYLIISLVFLIIFSSLFLLDLFLRYIQKRHTILANFGLFGAMRYALESIGPELRQYWIAADTEERPFSRRERTEVYILAKNEKINTSSFGTQEDLYNSILIRHSMFARKEEDLAPYSLTFGDTRACKNPYKISKPSLISAMSFGALGENAVRALARGAFKAGIPINCGEGGFPKYHLKEKGDLIFQIGTAKFGVRNDDASLNIEKLEQLSQQPQIKMIELKLSQGAKPGKGGMLLAAKVTPEIAELRGVTAFRDVVSPTRHVECDSAENTVKLIKTIQDHSELPVGIKLCIGIEQEFRDLISTMKQLNVFPDYIAIDGAEGGTGAAPRAFLDYVGMPLFAALDFVSDCFHQQGVRKQFKLLAAGKLVNPGRQVQAMAFGADAVYSARGFMLALGCIQALQCNSGGCPVGITTQDKSLQAGLDIELKSERVYNYAKNLYHGIMDLLAATGYDSLQALNKQALFIPDEYKMLGHNK